MLFSGRKKVVVQPSVPVEAKLQQYQQGLEQIVADDRARHAKPVLKEVKTDELVRQARSFLERQVKSGPGTPTPFLIGMAGGTASGKSFVKNIWHRIFPRQAMAQVGWNEPYHGPVVSGIELDNYYKDTSERRKQLGDAAYFQRTNLDSMRSVDLPQAAQDVMRLKNGRAVRHPKYNFLDSSTTHGASLKVPTPFFFVEGLFALAHKPLRNLMDMKIFVDADEAVRSQRWWKRSPERNIHPNAAGNALFNRAMSTHNKHVEPSKAHANVVMNGTADRQHIEAVLGDLTALMVKVFHP